MLIGFGGVPHKRGASLRCGVAGVGAWHAAIRQRGVGWRGPDCVVLAGRAGGDAAGKPCRARGTRRLAAPVLGTACPLRGRAGGVSALLLVQPGEARPRRAAGGLAPVVGAPGDPDGDGCGGVGCVISRTVAGVGGAVRDEHASCACLFSGKSIQFSLEVKSASPNRAIATHQVDPLMHEALSLFPDRIRTESQFKSRWATKR